MYGLKISNYKYSNFFLFCSSSNETLYGSSMSIIVVESVSSSMSLFAFDLSMKFDIPFLLKTLYGCISLYEGNAVSCPSTSRDSSQRSYKCRYKLCHAVSLSIFMYQNNKGKNGYSRENKC